MQAFEGARRLRAVDHVAKIRASARKLLTARRRSGHACLESVAVREHATELARQARQRGPLELLCLGEHTEEL